MHYLGGHDHNSVNGKRLLLNALLTPADRSNNCGLTICSNIINPGDMNSPKNTNLCTGNRDSSLPIPIITPTTAFGGSGDLEYTWQKRHGGSA